jgi:hypothetical protein
VSSAGSRAQAEIDGASLESVERHYADARDLATALSMRPVVAGCHLGLGRFLRRIRHSERAADHLSHSARLYEEMGLQSLRARIAAE